MKAALAEKEKRSRNKLAYFFPQEGPFRRELYPKHLQFFRGGGPHDPIPGCCPPECTGEGHRERCFIAANRIGKCIRINTLVDTTRGKISVGDLLADGKPFDVWAWDGEKRVVARATVPFRKSGLHDCYRLTMSDGQWVECADDHRLLTSFGWRLLSELLPNPPESISERGFLVHGEDGLRWSETHRGYPDGYFADCHHDGEPPRYAEDSDLVSAPLLAGARQPSVVGWRMDGQGSRCTNSARLAVSHLSNQDDQHRIEGRFVEFEGRSENTNAEWLCDLSLTLGLLELASAVELRSCREPDVGIADIVSVASNRIIRCDYIGRHEVYDFTVDRWHNYIAADLVHHNTSAGVYETVLHLTGKYPDWWTGKRFRTHIKAWAASDTNKTVRGVLQEKFLGPINAPGTGLIPADDIVYRTTKAGIAEAVDTIYVRHVSGGMSSVQLKSYQEGRESFQADTVDFVLLDEEPSLAIYAEALVRTMSTDGQVALVFTPLQGLSEVVLSFMPEGKHNGREEEAR